jgi:hypothetical protein
MNIYLRTTLSGMTHFNVRASPVYGQFENVKGHINLRVRPGQRITYSVQACRRGSGLSRSFCTKWAAFHHDVDRPRGIPSRFEDGVRRCPPGRVWRPTPQGGYCMPARWR